MLSKVNSAAPWGIDGYIVSVETDVSNGAVAFDIVGLPDAAVKESKERVRSAIRNSGFSFPTKRIVTNLAPADTKKEGAYLDLPISIAILSSTGQIRCDDKNEYLFLGELSLDGEIRKAHGVLPMTVTARDNGIKKIILPMENAEEAAVVSGVDIYPAKTLREVCDHLNGKIPIKIHKSDISGVFVQSKEYANDLCYVKGQENVKRALEIAAAGSHNCLMIGSPGSGKTMLAKCLPSILPDLTFEEALEITKIYSIAGKLPAGKALIDERPFRNPHHTISAAAITGGGSVPKPGEISLAHRGVLFLDEFPEFPKSTIDAMRQPLEDGCFTVGRVAGTFTFPSETMLVASMNPCKCGYFGDPSGKCNCSPNEIQRYLGRISGPMLDRFDIHIQVPTVDFDSLSSDIRSESSKTVRERVNKAREIQLERFKGKEIFSNSQLNQADLENFCQLDSTCKELLRQVFERMGLSARAHSRIVKVSRTIADLDGKDRIDATHIAEAIRYRSLDRKFWFNKQ